MYIYEKLYISQRTILPASFPITKPNNGVTKSKSPKIKATWNRFPPQILENPIPIEARKLFRERNIASIKSCIITLISIKTAQKY